METQYALQTQTPNWVFRSLRLMTSNQASKGPFVSRRDFSSCCVFSSHLYQMAGKRQKAQTHLSSAKKKKKKKKKKEKVTPKPGRKKETLWRPFLLDRVWFISGNQRKSLAVINNFVAFPSFETNNGFILQPVGIVCLAKVWYILFLCAKQQHTSLPLCTYFRWHSPPFYSLQSMVVYRSMIGVSVRVCGHNWH